MAPSCKQRDGFSLIEVMIVVMILSVGLVIMLGNIFSLGKAHAGNKEQAKVQELMQVLAERIEGGTWSTLGQITQPWSWSRRDTTGMTPVPTTNPPMTEQAADPNNDLIRLGLISAVSNTQDSAVAALEAGKGGSGLQNLQVYVEYYDMAIMSDPLLPSDPKGTRLRHTFPQGSAPFDLRNVSDAIIVRIVVRWDQASGGSRFQELMLARRQ